MDNVLALQMLDPTVDTLMHCGSWVSCNSNVSCKSNTSGGGGGGGPLQDD